MAHIIVVGNEKGGSGKSTTSMHVATALARMGHRVGTLDLDLRQQSLGRYIENRRAFCARSCQEERGAGFATGSRRQGAHGRPGPERPPC